MGVGYALGHLQRFAEKHRDHNGCETMPCGRLQGEPEIIADLDEAFVGQVRKYPLGKSLAAPQPLTES